MSPSRNRVDRRRVLRRIVGATAAIGLGSAATAGAGAQDTDNASESTTAEESDGGTESQYTRIYEETIDDVVLVTVGGTDTGTGGGLGSGFVVDDYVVTNAHVVAGSSEVELQFSDEQWRTASVVGTDTHGDLAVLEADDLPDAVDGLSFAEERATIGQEVVALGNPLGLDASISQGIVSGVDRSLPSPTGFSIPAAIQTDAPVNPGNSGGPLVDLEGNVVGVVFAGAGQAIGFAISAALAQRIVPALVEDGEYEHPYMGVSVLPVGPQVAEANDLEDPRGVLVTETVPGSPADGVLQPVSTATTVDGDVVPVGGDVIVAIGDRAIPNQEQLSSALALRTEPGETISLAVIRDGQRETVELTLEPRPDVDVP